MRSWMDVTEREAKEDAFYEAVEKAAERKLRNAVVLCDVCGDELSSRYDDGDIFVMPCGKCAGEVVERPSKLHPVFAQLFAGVAA